MAEDILKLSEEVSRGCGKDTHYYGDYNVDKEKCNKNYLCPSCQKSREVLLKTIEDEIRFLNLGKIKIEGRTKEMEFLIRKRIELLNKCKEILK